MAQKQPAKEINKPTNSRNRITLRSDGTLEGDIAFLREHANMSMLDEWYETWLALQNKAPATTDNS